MKALKSRLATELLADPEASEQLRRFLVSQHSSALGGRAVTEHLVVNRSNGVVRVEATFVPKAAKAA